MFPSLLLETSHHAIEDLSLNKFLNSFVVLYKNYEIALVNRIGHRRITFKHDVDDNETMTAQVLSVL